MKTWNNFTRGEIKIDTSDQYSQVDRDEDTAETGDVETKQHENISTRPRNKNLVKGVERLDIKFGGNEYGT